MTLIDYWRMFQVASSRRKFSANARSLYFAILGEFNDAFYPEELYLRNGNLQDRSSIYSTSSFDSARTALINAKLITHKKNYYKLLYNPDLVKDLEKAGKNDVKVVENAIVRNTCEQKEDKDQDKEFTPAASCACAGEDCTGGNGGGRPARKSVKFAGDAESVESVGSVGSGFNADGMPSIEVLTAWRKGGGVPLNFYQLALMARLEAAHGSAEVIAKIELAGLKDARGRLTLQFLEAFFKEGKGTVEGVDSYGYGEEDWL